MSANKDFELSLVSSISPLYKIKTNVNIRLPQNNTKHKYLTFYFNSHDSFNYCILTLQVYTFLLASVAKNYFDRHQSPFYLECLRIDFLLFLIQASPMRLNYKFSFSYLTLLDLNHFMTLHLSNSHYCLSYSFIIISHFLL